MRHIATEIEVYSQRHPHEDMKNGHLYQAFVSGEKLKISLIVLDVQVKKVSSQTVMCNLK